MREYIRIGPPHQVQPRPCGHKVETGGGDLEAVLALEHRVKADAQGMQIEDVGRRVGKLRLRERRVPPIGGLLLLRQFNAEKFPRQILKPCRSV